VQDEIERLERSVAARPPKRKNQPPLDDVAALAAMLHIGFAAREARTIVTTARKRTGMKKATLDRRIVNEDRARALLRRPTSVD